MSIIRILDSHIVHQIAAGEVVERPASVLKELVENSIDAEATSITIRIRCAGQSFLSVQDNGKGMCCEDLMKCIQPHATSKLPDNNLYAIHTFGFRGEALASIHSVARIVIKSGQAGQEHAWSYDGTALSPCPWFQGTCVEVQDLFYTTPARLKFLRSEAVENSHMQNILEKIMLLHPDVHFRVHNHGKETAYDTGIKQRLSLFLGKNFLENAFFVDEKCDDHSLFGYVGVPTYNRAQPDQQIFFVNGRWVKDKTMHSCLKHAMQDVLPQQRHAVAVLFLTIPSTDLDVNVHPAKTEVRFRDTRKVHAFVCTMLKRHIPHQPVSSILPNMPPDQSLPSLFPDVSHVPVEPPPSLFPHLSHAPTEKSAFLEPLSIASASIPSLMTLKESSFPSESEVFSNMPSKTIHLGHALCQLHQQYILAINGEGLVVVDPHAAHERIVYEKMKIHDKSTMKQAPLLIPVQVPLSAEECKKVQNFSSILFHAGFDIRFSSDEECIVHAMPHLFECCDPYPLLSNLLSLITEEHDDPCAWIQHWIDHMMANWACRRSIKMGRSLSLEDMNILLRTLEQTPHGAQCNHGRPVYKVFPLSYFNQLFERR